MKKIITIITLLFALSVNVSAYKVVKFTIRDGISDKALKDNMERTVTRLLNEINRCQEENVGKITLLAQYMLPEAVDDIVKLWANEHFRCEEDIVEDVLQTLDGYQVTYSSKYQTGDSLTMLSPAAAILIAPYKG